MRPPGSPGRSMPGPGAPGPSPAGPAGHRRTPAARPPFWSPPAAPCRLALVPVIGAPRVASSASATGWLGTRTATVSPGTAADRQLGRRFKTRVSGPGHAASVSPRTHSGTSWHTTSSQFRSGRKIGSASPGGRPLSANSRLIATSWSASAAMPYCVSVGTATRPPPRRIAAAHSTGGTSSSASSLILRPSLGQVFLTRVYTSDTLALGCWQMRVASLGAWPRSTGRRRFSRRLRAGSWWILRGWR